MTFEAMNASIPNPQQTSIPDPQKTLTAFFDTLDHAEAAVDAVKAAGVATRDIQLVEGGADESVNATTPRTPPVRAIAQAATTAAHAVFPDGVPYRTHKE